jgi:hypothetical protein
LELSKDTNSATRSGRSDLSQRWKRRYPVFRAPHVSMRPQSSTREESAPKSKAMWGNPLPIAMGIGGRIGAGVGRWVENDLTWRRQKRAFFIEDGSGAGGESTGGRDEAGGRGRGKGGAAGTGTG